MNTATTKKPFCGGTCYACDAKATGLRDLTPSGGVLESACPRHADPTIAVFEACMYCETRVRAGSFDVDGCFAHKSCHRAEML